MNRPYYVVDENKLRANLELISKVAKEADVEIILAFKAFALWKTFPIFREYIRSTTASSLYEARLAYEEFGTKAHTFSPAYADYEWDEIARCSSHISFNSEGDMVIDIESYPLEKDRKFYGMKKNGREFFTDNNGIIFDRKSRR